MDSHFAFNLYSAASEELFHLGGDLSFLFQVSEPCRPRTAEREPLRTRFRPGVEEGFPLITETKDVRSPGRGSLKVQLGHPKKALPGPSNRWYSRTLRGGFPTPVVTRKHLLEGAPTPKYPLLPSTWATSLPCSHALHRKHRLSSPKASWKHGTSSNDHEHARSCKRFPRSPRCFTACCIIFASF